MAMCMSGAVTGMVTNFPAAQILRVQRLASSAWFAVVPGTSAGGTAAAPSAAGMIPAFAATSTASGQHLFQWGRSEDKQTERWMDD